MSDLYKERYNEEAKVSACHAIYIYVSRNVYNLLYFTFSL